MLKIITIVLLMLFGNDAENNTVTIHISDNPYENAYGYVINDLSVDNTDQYAHVGNVWAFKHTFGEYTLCRQITDSASNAIFFESHLYCVDMEGVQVEF